MQTDTARYGRVAMAFHWTIVVLLVLAVGLGFQRSAMDRGAARDAVFAFHKSIGMLIFALAVLRLGWRLTHPVPPIPSDMGAFQRIAASAVHWLLYVMMFIQPLTGYLAEAARGRTTAIFSVLTLPNLAPLDRQFSHLMEEIHVASQYALYALVLAHVGAALHHHFILRDRVLARMWPFGKVAT